MDNKITKPRLKQILSYDLIKIVAIIAASVLVWSLAFTMFGDSLSEGQMLNVYSYGVHVVEAEMDKFMKGGEYDDYTSYDARETSYMAFTGDAFAQQFQAWNSVGQLDIFFVHDVDNIEKTDDNGPVKDENGNAVYMSFFDQYSGYFTDLDELADMALEYCYENGYSKDGTVDKAAIEKKFFARKKGDNFLRHGLINADMEADRFALIWKNANTLKSWLTDPAIDIWAYADPIKEGGEKWKAGIDMGKLDDYPGQKKAVELCSNYQKLPDEQEKKDGDEEDKVSSASGVVMAVMNNYDVADDQHDLMYESLAFVVKVVTTYTNLGVK